MDTWDIPLNEPACRGMKLVFLGTRGYIDARTRRHRRHSALLVTYRERRVMIDCGADWAGRLDEVSPHAIFVTHGHPDHAFGLKDDADCPVYATAETQETLSGFPIRELRTVSPREPVRVGGIAFEAFRVVHSLRAPAVGYRVSAGQATVFYVPDVIDIRERDHALAGVHVYIGDGASLTRPLVRRRGNKLFGHTTVCAQLDWCGEAGIGRAVFTHCGSQVVEGDERVLGAKVRAMGRERGVRAKIAHDGMGIILR